MAPRLTGLSFDAWVRHLFDHPADGPCWYDDPDAPYWAGPPGVGIAWATRLLADPLPTLAPYGDAQLDRGLWYLVSNGLSDVMVALADDRVALDARVACVRAFTPLFREVYAVRCTPHLSHRDEPGTGALNRSCYMWWDLLPLAGAPADPRRGALDRAALDVMAETLALDAVACQESALHGLGHWRHAYPREVEAIVDRFLAARPAARPELLVYARSARTGCVQ